MNYRGWTITIHIQQPGGWCAVGWKAGQTMQAVGFKTVDGVEREIRRLIDAAETKAREA